MNLTLDEITWRNLGQRRHLFTKYIYNKIIYGGLNKAEYFDLDKIEERYEKSSNKRSVLARE